MITIELHQEQRVKLLQTIKDTHQLLVKSDLDFWKKSMKDIFSQHPVLQTVGWHQGFFYNDENYAFRVRDFLFNDLDILYKDYEYNPERDFSHRTGLSTFDSAKTYLMHPKEDKEKYELAWNSQASNSKNKAYTIDVFCAEMKEKYAIFLPAARAISELLSKTYQQFGERHFADTFGKKAKIVFNTEGLLIEDYEDDEVAEDGALEDLID